MVRGKGSEALQGGRDKKWLATSGGWYRGQLFLNTLQAPPPPGSLQEWVCLLVMDRLENIEHARFRALAQLLIESGSETHEQGLEAFEDYMNIAFPGTANKKKKEKDKILDQLKWWINRGPMTATPMPEFEKKGKSRMVHRVAQVDTGERSQLYSRLRNRG